jgi:hypothetical protein
LKKIIKHILLLSLLFIGTGAFAQNPLLYGVIIDENRNPVEGVSIYYEDNGKKVEVITDPSGFYALEIPANKDVIVWFLSYKLYKIIFSP